MKTLYIVRHGKAMLRAADQMGDYHRTLIEKGINRTKKLVAQLQLMDEKTELIISSPAVRAIETAKIIAVDLGYPIEKIQLEEGLYVENEIFMFDLISQISEEIDRVMIVGHNPTLTNFLNHFLSPPLDWFKTSSMACLVFETDDWTEITKANNQLVYFYPEK